MSVAFFMDHQVRRVVTAGLRRRGVGVSTAEEDGSQKLSDPELLTRAAVLGRVLFTQDRHFLADAARRLYAGEHFAGIVYVRQATDRSADHRRPTSHRSGDRSLRVEGPG